MSGGEIARGIAGRELGIARATRAANPEWETFMDVAVVEVARRKRWFTADDIERLRLAKEGPETHEKRAMSGVMRRAQTAGVCEITNRFEAGVRATCHRRPQRVWRSLIFEGGTVGG